MPPAGGRRARRWGDRRSRRGRPLAAGVEAVAVSLLHSYAKPGRTSARSATRSRRRCRPGRLAVVRRRPAYREYERTSTTVVNAALRPLLRGYLLRLADGCESAHRGPAVRHAVGRRRGHGRAAPRRPAAVIESGPASGSSARLRGALARHPARALVRHGRHDGEGGLRGGRRGPGTGEFEAVFCHGSRFGAAPCCCGVLCGATPSSLCPVVDARAVS